MKFCTNCGNQLDDNTLFCGACGAKQVIAEAPATEAPAEAPAAPVAEAPVAPVAETAPRKSGLPALFAFIGDMMAILASFLMVTSVAAAYIDVNVGISKYSGSGLYGYADLEPAPGCAIFGFLFSFGVIGMGVLSLILSLKKKEGLKGLFGGIKQITVGTLLFILGIVLFANF